MSSDLPSGARSRAAEATRAPASALGLATLVKARGAVLLDALERYRPGALEHAEGTGTYAFAAAAELGLSRDHALLVRETARLHDVGRVYLPAAVLAKPWPDLEPAERELIDAHPVYGAALARGAAVPEPACEWLGAVRQRFDGAGPGGLAGERIPLESRLIRVACACDSLLAAAPPAGAEDGAHATALLREAGGRELDPEVVEALAAILGRATGGGP